jgi:hypothetical protein
LGQYNIFVYQMGELVVGAALLFGLGWLAMKSQYFGAGLKFLYFLGWFAITPCVFIFVAFAIYLPNHPVQAVLSLLLGAILTAPWFIVALPEIKRTMRHLRKDYT